MGLFTGRLPGSCETNDLGLSERLGSVTAPPFREARILGALCSVLGGYVSARIAKHHEILNGALSSILCIGFGVYALFSGSAADQVGLHLVFLPLSPALGAFGGYLSSRRNARRR